MSHSKPIAFCITDLDSGGAEQALVQIVTRLDRGEWSPRVFCLSGEGELANVLRDAGVPVTCFGATRWSHFGVLLRLKRELKQMQPVVLQTFLYHANILGRIAGRMANVPVILSGIRVAERRSRFRLWLDRVTERWVSRHICVSEDVATFSIEVGGLSRDKVVVIPNGVDFDRFAKAEPADRAEFGMESCDRLFLFVGRLDPQKGILLLLEAFAELTSTHSDVRLLIVGDGPLRADVERFVDSAGLHSRVHLTGRRDDVPQIMKAVDCFVLPSLWEGMPNVVLEAMAACIPVIATAVEGCGELIENGKTGRLIPPDNRDALVSALRDSLASVDAAQSMEKRAQVVVSESFTWISVSARYQQTYRDLCGIKQ